MKIYSKLLMMAAVLSGCAQQAKENPVLTIEGGQIQGVETDGVYAYKGIPYAAAPINDLRWKAPQPVIAWDGVRDATQFGPSPMQEMNFNNSEDCLYLNVWTPAITKKDKLPVMVWIYGGAFAMGTSSFYDGTALASKGVILVTINYRVGRFGFFSHPELSAETEQNVSGNYGLLDQIAALKWVKENIANFGGDPGNVTIFGESAGGISVSMLCASPLANGLFQRAISQSGGSMGPSRIESFAGENMKPLPIAEKEGEEYGLSLGCATIAELRALDAQTLNAHTPFTGGPWPIIDGYVIPDDQYRMYEDGNYNKVDILVGYNSDEGWSFNDFKETDKHIEAVNHRYGPFAEKLLRAYPVSGSIVPKSGRDITRDAAFGWPTWAWASLQAKDGGNNVYMYVFDQYSEYPEDSPLYTQQSPHGQDTDYVFGSLRPSPDRPTDAALSEAMMTYWTNFAKTGNPNSESVPFWPEYTGVGGQVMILQGDKPFPSAVPDEESLKVMDEYYRWRRTPEGDSWANPGRLLIRKAVPAYWQNPTGMYNVAVDSDVMLSGHTVFYPENLTAFPEKDKLPVVIMTGPGADATSSAFRPFFTEVASHGYLMIVCGTLTEETVNTGKLPKATKEDMITAIDWAIAENSREASPFFGKIDTENICLMGQSAGGIHAIDNMNDPRVTLLTLFDSGLFKENPNSNFNFLSRSKKEVFRNVTIPMAYFVGGTDMARVNAEDDFELIDSVPIVLAVRDIPWDAHAGTFREKNGGAFAVACVRWLDWNTKMNMDAAAFFEGSKPGISKDPKWISYKKKNIQ